MHELHQLSCTKYWKKYSHDNNSLTSATCTEARKLYLFDAHDDQNSTCLILVKHLPPDCRVSCGMEWAQVLCDDAGKTLHVEVLLRTCES